MQGKFVPVLVGLAITSSSFARQCPDCDVQYWTCSWGCYEQFGSAPICASLISYKTGKAEDYNVFNNECEAGCYVKAYNEFYAVQGYEPMNEQQPDASCDAAWRLNQALDYQFFSSPDAFKYNDKLPSEGELPKWMQDELAEVNADPSLANDPTLALTLEECSRCKPGADISGKEVLLTSDGTLVRAGETGSVTPPASEVPLPSVPGLLPSMAPGLLPSMAPGLLPSMAPGPLPSVPAVTVPPTEIIVPGGPPPSAAIGSRSALSVMASLGVGAVLAFVS